MRLQVLLRYFFFFKLDLVIKLRVQHNNMSIMVLLWCKKNTPNCASYHPTQPVYSFYINFCQHSLDHDDFRES